MDISSDSRFSRQIKKGVLEMLVLELLSREPGYGYQLISRLSQAPNGTLTVKEGTLYPILYRLEEEGLLRSDWLTGSGRAAPKKIYTVTSDGQKTLEQQKEIFSRFQADIACIISSGGSTP